MDMNSAVVLLSGGQDSTTCLAWAMKKFETVHTISFYYGQRHAIELQSAVEISREVKAESHYIVHLDNLFNQIIHSRLLEKNSPIDEPSEHDSDLPASFVPYRNVFFLTAAAAHAYYMKAGNIVTGICQTDYSGYPDCRNEFAKAINTALTLASAQPLDIHTPLMWLTKAESVKLMYDLGSLDLLKATHTCYEGVFPPCGDCPACVLRAKGFAEAGIPDPLIMRAVNQGDLPPNVDPYSGKMPIDAA